MNAERDVPLIRRIVAVLDASARGQAAVEAAAELAARLEVELAGVFVEDPALRHMASLASTRQVQRFPAALRACSRRDMEYMMESQQHRARRSLARAVRRGHTAWSFQVVRGRRAAALAAASKEADLLVVDRIGDAAGGASCSLMSWAGAHPVMVIPRRMTLPRSVAVLHDGSDAADRALYLAAHLVRQLPAARLKVLFPGDERRKMLLEELLSSLGVPTLLHAVTGASLFELAARLSPREMHLIVLPRSLREEQTAEVEALLTALRWPYVLAP